MKAKRLLRQGEEQIKKVPRRGLSKRRAAMGAFAGLVLAAGGAYTQKDNYTDDLANLSRSIIGGNNTARVERIYFSVEASRKQYAKAYVKPATPTASPKNMTTDKIISVPNQNVPILP